MTDQARPIALLPEDMEAATIGRMTPGQGGYAKPWAMSALNDRTLWLKPGWSVRDEPTGEFVMRVECREDGWHVWRVKGYRYLVLREGVELDDPAPRLPVVDLHDDPADDGTTGRLMMARIHG